MSMIMFMFRFSENCMPSGSVPYHNGKIITNSKFHHKLFGYTMTNLRLETTSSRCLHQRKRSCFGREIPISLRSY